MHSSKTPDANKHNALLLSLWSQLKCPGEKAGNGFTTQGFTGKISSGEQHWSMS